VDVERGQHCRTETYDFSEGFDDGDDLDTNVQQHMEFAFSGQRKDSEVANQRLISLSSGIAPGIRAVPLESGCLANGITLLAGVLVGQPHSHKLAPRRSL